MTETNPSGTNNHGMVKVIGITLPVIYIEYLLKLLTYNLYLHDFMHCAAATLLAYAVITLNR